MKLFLKNEKGMTLVELVVTLLLMSIALGSIGSMIPMVQKHYARAEAISYKQGTITDVETRLQNALGRGTFIFIKDTPDGDYNLGFNDEGQCVEVTKLETEGEPEPEGKAEGEPEPEGELEPKTVTVVIDQISEITLLVGAAKQVGGEATEVKKTEGEEAQTIQTYTMEYQLIPKDTTMSTLAGGTVMNNIVVDSNYKEEDFKSGEVLSSEFANKYLVIDFGKRRDSVPRTLYERMLQTYHDFWKIRNRKEPTTPTDQEFKDAQFIQASGAAGHYANNDIFRNRLFEKWYVDTGTLPRFDPNDYVYASDNETVPVYKTKEDPQAPRYVNPYIFDPKWDDKYNENPQIILFAGKKLSCGHGNQDWNTSFIFLADDVDEKGEVFGNWYYNKNYNGEKSYIYNTTAGFEKLKKEIYDSAKKPNGDWEKLILKK